MKKLISILLVSLIVPALLCSCDLSEILKQLEDLEDIANNIAESVAIERGVTENDTYTNQSIGVTFTKPSDWSFYTDEQIAEIMNISTEIFKDKDLMASAEVTTVVEFMAVDAMGYNNVNMSVENLVPSGNILLSAEEYAEVFKSSLVNAQDAIEYQFSEETKVTLGGTEYVRITASADYSGITMSQYAYIAKVSTSMVVISATTVNGTAPEVFEDMFS